MKTIFTYFPTESEDYLCLSQNRFAKFRGDPELIFPIVPATGITMWKKEGYEVYDVITEDPKKLVKVLNELEDIGEAKLFLVGRISQDYSFKLTEKQANAIQLAVSHNFYDWPRKVSLDEVSAMVGMKRRTFQENLRKAESKIMPHLINSFFAKQGA